MVCLNSLIKVSLAVSMSLFYFYLQLDLFKQRPDSFLRLAKVNLDVNKCYTGDWRVLGCIFLINVFFIVVLNGWYPAGYPAKSVSTDTVVVSIKFLHLFCLSSVNPWLRFIYLFLFKCIYSITLILAQVNDFLLFTLSDAAFPRCQSSTTTPTTRWSWWSAHSTVHATASWRTAG